MTVEDGDYIGHSECPFCGEKARCLIEIEDGSSIVKDIMEQCRHLHSFKVTITEHAGIKLNPHYIKNPKTKVIKYSGGDYN